MKVFDLSQLKKTAKIKDSDPSRSYSQIHKSPTKTSIREPIAQSFFLSRWGKNITNKNSKNVPQSPWVNVGQGITSVSLGEEHSLIINNKYQCFGYGSNYYGQLALQSQHNSRPSQLTSLKQMRIVSVACGSYHSFVQNTKGQIYGFGLNLKGQLGIGSYQNKKKPSLIYSLLPNGIKNSKSNFFIQTSQYKKKIKRNKQENSQFSNITNLLANIQIDQKSPNFLLAPQQSIISIACGPLHSLMLSNKGRLFSCGFGQKYSLGHGKNKSLNQFTQVKLKSCYKIDKIQCGISSSGFLASGKVYVVGSFDQKTYQTFTNISSCINEEVVDFKMGHDKVILLSKRGEVYQFGLNYREEQKYFSEVPKKVQKLSGIISIFRGMNCFFAVSQNKACFGWGQNTHNQITGVNDEHYITAPKALRIPICINQSVQIVSGNGTTFLLSSSPLNQDTISQSSDSFAQCPESIQVALNKKSSSKFVPSNICKTEEKNLLNQMGIQPRSFNCNMEIDFNQIVLGPHISEGGYGIIYKGLWRETTVAIKIFKIQTQSAVKDFFSECAAMQALRHPNVVMFLGACTKPPNFAIVLQYCSKGSLWSTIQNLNFPLSWEDRVRFALDTAKGVNYLHTCNPPILHRDLKSLNLLLDDSYKVKLADFGWTRGLDNFMTGKIGTYQWMAPQVIASQKYSQKADVFSYGIILWEIASREPPFKHLNGLQVSMQVLNNDMRPPIPKKTPQCYVKLMKKCWDRQPSKRPSFKQIIKELQAMKFE